MTGTLLPDALVLPERLALDLLLDVFDRRVTAYRLQLQRCRASFDDIRGDDEAVHDLRVAIRRLLALLDVLRSPGFALRGRKLRRVLKSQLASLSQLRDIQVIRGETVLLLPAGRARQSFLQQLRAREADERELLVQLLVDAEDGKLARRLARQRRRLARGGHDCAAGLQLALNVAWARLWQCHGGASRDLLASIHRERIACKRYRYCVEILAALLPAAVSKVHLQTLRDYQDRLGAVQDAEVLLASVQHGSGGQRTASATRLLAAAVQLRDERVAAYWQRRDSLAALQLPFIH